MPKLGINTGNNPNDGQGDPLRVAMGKINSNFTELYNTLGDGTTLASYVSSAGIATLAKNLTGNPRINVSGILNTGITTTEHLEVRNITSTGVVTATQFVGDGSQLRNVTALVAGLEVLDDNVRKGVARELNFGDNIVSTGPDGVGRVTISVGSTISYASTYSSTAGVATYATSSGISTYASIAGVSTYSNISGISGISTYASIAGVSTNATYATTAGVSTYSSISGISTNSTYATSSGISSYSSIAGIATYASTTGISSALTSTTSVNTSGIITASSFSGSGSNLTSLNATQLTSGTVPSARITSSSGDFTVGSNLYVNGTLSVGGTSVILNAQQLQIADKDIVVGYTTNAFGNDVSNDTTANHGGISVASTVGYPIINIPLQAGINSNPSTYKQMMWVKQGNYSGMGTDAWVFNYAVSIGNTSTVQNNSRLTVGAGFTVYDTYIDIEDIRSGNINVSGIVTSSNGFVGSLFGNATSSTTSGYALTSGISTASQGLTGTPNITVGIETSTISIPTQLRTRSVAEKTTLVAGNTVGLAFTIGGGNVAICTTPTGDITLNVTDIPTDSSFDNHSISFSVVVNQTGTSRTCTTVTLNGVSKTIKWAGGSLANAISGVTTSTGFDIFTFTGINTVGSASTTANYTVLGSVSGGFN